MALLTVEWVGLQCVAVVFPDHTHLLFIHFTPLVLGVLFASRGLPI